LSVDFQQQIIDEFRANRGQVAMFGEGARLLLLTTTGARTGARHTVPLGYLPDGGDRVLVIASAGGSPRHPDWFHNVVAHPRVHVEDGVFNYDADASVLEGAERDRAFARAMETDPGWADYESRSGRTLPVVAVTALPGPPGYPPGTSAGQMLAVVHDAFRRELALIRAEIAGTGSRLGAQLRVNCLTVCAGLHRHHLGEGTMMFPALARRRPELEPVLRRLHAEHETIAALVARLQELLAADGTGPAAVRAEVERLVDELERHLTYEEEQLIPVLDAP
jgi:deazaflavin-dependent oxidoreductase (nitroreductase family)